MGWTQYFTNIALVQKEFLAKVGIYRGDRPAVFPFAAALAPGPGDARGLVMHGGIPYDPGRGRLHGFYEHSGSGISDIGHRSRSGVYRAPSIGIHPAPLGKILEPKDMGDDDRGDNDKGSKRKKILPAIHGQ